MVLVIKICHVDTGEVYFVIDFNPPVSLSLYLIVNHENTYVYFLMYVHVRFPISSVLFP